MPCKKLLLVSDNTIPRPVENERYTIEEQRIDQYFVTWVESPIFDFDSDSIVTSARLQLHGKSLYKGICRNRKQTCREFFETRRKQIEKLFTPVQTTTSKKPPLSPPPNPHKTENGCISNTCDVITNGIGNRLATKVSNRVQPLEEANSMPLFILPSVSSLSNTSNIYHPVFGMGLPL